MALPIAALMFAGGAVAKVLQTRSQLEQAKKAAALEQKQIRQSIDDEIDAASARAYTRSRTMARAVGAQQARTASGGVSGGSANIALEDTIGSFLIEAQWDKTAVATTVGRLNDAIRISQENLEIARRQATLNMVTGLFGSAVQIAPALQNEIDTIVANQKMRGIQNARGFVPPLNPSSLYSPNPDVFYSPDDFGTPSLRGRTGGQMYSLLR